MNKELETQIVDEARRQLYHYMAGNSADSKARAAQYAEDNNPLNAKVQHSINKDNPLFVIAKHSIIELDGLNNRDTAFNVDKRFEEVRTQIPVDIWHLAKSASNEVELQSYIEIGKDTGGGEQIGYSEISPYAAILLVLCLIAIWRQNTLFGFKKPWFKIPLFLTFAAFTGWVGIAAVLFASTVQFVITKQKKSQETVNLPAIS